MSIVTKQASGPVYRWRGKVADETAMDGISTPLNNDFCERTDDMAQKTLYVYNTSKAEWNKTDNNGGLIGNFKKSQLWIQQATAAEGFLCSTGDSPQWIVTEDSQQIYGNNNTSFGSYISVRPFNDDTDSKVTVRVVAI